MSNATLGPVPPFESSPWGEVARLCRRICVLRAGGNSVEAARVQSAELARAVAAARTPTETNADVESRLRTLFTMEEERVATASALAELLAPLLAERLRNEAPARALPAPRETAEFAPAVLRPARAAAPSIADFIDEMLGQERAAAAPPPLRRAS